MGWSSTPPERQWRSLALVAYREERSAEKETEGVHIFKSKPILIVRLSKLLVDRTILKEVVQLTRPACVVSPQLVFSRMARQDNIQNASKGDSFLSRLWRGHKSLVSDIKSSLSRCCIHLDLASPLTKHCLLLIGLRYAAELGITATFLGQRIHK